MIDESQVKRFVAPNMSRALEMVRESMGADAIILSSRRVDDGVEIVTSAQADVRTRGVEQRKSFGQKFDVEYDTAMESDAAWQVQAGVDSAADKYRQDVRGSQRATQRSPEALAKEIEIARERMLEAKRAAEQENSSQSLGLNSARRDESSKASKSRQGSTLRKDANIQSRLSSSNDTEEKKLSALEGELADMRMILEQQLWQMSQGTTTTPLTVVKESKPDSSRNSILTNHLQRLGLQANISEKILRETRHVGRVSDSWRDCMAVLAKSLPTSNRDIVGDGGVFSFVGPTGVGKTTTIAKLAARYVLKHGPGRVALVTTDTYRVGAQDQLRSMGRILNVPVRTVDTDNSLHNVLASLRHFDLVLVDTAGFSVGDKKLNKQLATLDSCNHVKRILVSSCNSQALSQSAAYRTYSSKRGIDATVLTKLDETASLGEALSVICEKQIPVLYTTDGQDIPRDISLARGHDLVARAVTLLRAGYREGAEVAGF